MFRARWQGAILAVALLAAALPRPAAAQSLIRDAEIERTLGRIADPLLRTAGLSPGQVDIYILNDPEPGAFVAGGNNIFLHTGLLRELESIDQLRAVIAHELGHIVGGHIARRDQQIRQARGTTALGAVLSIVAAAAGGGADAALATGSLFGTAANRNLLAHSRAEEGAADQAAVNLMAGAGAQPQAMLEVMEKFRGQAALHVGPGATGYTSTHPLWSDRIRYLEERVANAPKGHPPGEEDRYWYGRMVAKLDAFLASPRTALALYRGDESENGLMARAIAWHRLPDLGQARAAMDKLLAARPDDPYTHEMDGQFRLENGEVEAAVAAYRRAAELLPYEPLILSGLGRALVARDTRAADAEALKVLTRARQLDRADAMALRNLAVVHARMGDEGQASLATAERMMLAGRLQDAGIHATRAMRALPRGGPGWRQAEEIVEAARRTERERR